MNKTILVIGVIFLFISVSFTGTSNILFMRKPHTLCFESNILFVGGNGSDNYSKIQDAIDDAIDGDTVFVYNDSSPYYESLIIDKSIKMIGEDRNTTVIDDNEGISIKKSGVIINGFTIKHGGISTYYYDMVNLEFTNNHFIKCKYGINILLCNNNLIISNLFNNCECSIYSIGKNITITDNIMIYSLTEDNNLGEIYFRGGKHIITNNTFINYKKEVYRTGLLLDYPGYSIIEKNVFNGYEDAILIYFSNKNIISENNFINNTCGINIGSYSSVNKIIVNNFINNKIDASAFFLAFENIFDGNYWDDWIGIKNPKLDFLPYFYFHPFSSFIDWHPASEAYNYTTTQGCVIE